MLPTLIITSCLLMANTDGNNNTHTIRTEQVYIRSKNTNVVLYHCQGYWKDATQPERMPKNVVNIYSH
jgi:hypothetical protein